MNSIKLILDKICKYKRQGKEFDLDELQNDIEEIYTNIKLKPKAEENVRILTNFIFTNSSKNDVVLGLTEILRVVCEDLNVPMPEMD